MGVGVMLSIAQAALGRVRGSAAVQAAAQDQITASPLAVAHSSDGVKVLPATPGVQCCRCWDRVVERPPRAHISLLNISREPCGRLPVLPLLWLPR